MDSGSGCLTSQPNVGQTVTLELLQGAGRIQLYHDPDGASPADVFGQALQAPKTYYVQGIDGSAALGDVELRLRFHDGDPLCEDRVNLTMFKVDLDGDADHDAALTVEGPDDELEDTLPGIIVLCNQDDDNQDTVVDNADDILNGNDDYDDLTPITIRQIPIVEPTWTVTLILENPTNVATGIDATEVVRVFPDTAANTVALLGPGTTSYTLVDSAPTHDVDLAALGAGDVTLWVEGLEFAGEVQLRLHVEDDAGRLTCEDRIQLKVAPLILLGHQNSAERSYVSRIGSLPELDPVEVQAESAAYTTQRFRNATPAGIVDEIIGDPLNGNTDQWAQDQFQIGFQESPTKAMFVVLDSKRDGELAAFPPSLLATDFGYVRPAVPGPTNAPSSFDSFGNLEVSPPCVVGGMSHVLGRVYYGFNPNAPDPDDTQIDPELRAFLGRQSEQSVVTFNTDWLHVGHVDEFMSIVPNPSATHGWSVLLADPVLALDILK